MTTTLGDFGLADPAAPVTQGPTVLETEPTQPSLTPQEAVIAKAINHGGSGRGVSFYSVAARCGRKARLQDVRHESVVEAGYEGLPEGKHALVIGSIYHLFHEQLRKPRPGLELDMSQAAYNSNVVEALRMYRGFINIWGKHYWGRPIAVEARLPNRALDREAIVARMGGELSGTVDMCVEMSEEDAARCQRRVPGITAGRYIVDWKTADGESDGIALTQGLQALWYPALWNLCFPDLPVDGIIFDIAMKRGRRRDRAMYSTDFQAILVRTPSTCIEDATRALRGMVRQGSLNVLHDIPNRAECVEWMGRICPFFNGACDGAMEEDKP